MAEYQYKVEDKAITQEFLTRWLWNPIVAHLPAKIAPNTITMIGAIFVMFSGYCVWLAVMEGLRLYFVVAAVCIFIYMTCDNVDGPHARHTGQSSRLGEFLDHWFDAVDTTIFNLCIMAMLNLSEWPTIICISLIALSFFATIWEHHHTGVFHSGKFGTNESLLLMIALYFLIAFLFQTPLVTYQGATTLNFASGLVYLGFIVGTWTVGSIIWRVRKYLYEFLPVLVAITAIIAWFWLGLLNHYWAAFFLLATNLLFSGRLLLMRLTKRNMAYRPWIVIMVSLVAIILLACLSFMPINIYPIFQYIVVALMITTLLSDLFYATLRLRTRKNV